jgi:DNA polymerase (family 10)
MENPEVAQVFEEIADLLEIQGQNPFRIRAYRNAARTLLDLGTPAAVLAAESNGGLQKLGGIGEDLADKIKTILATGDLPLLQELRRKVPRGLRELLSVPGLGPKRALVLYKKLHISDLGALQDAAQRRRIRCLKGFGEKTEAHILESLQRLGETSRRFYLSEAKFYAEALVRHLKGAAGVHAIEAAGSYRRRKETVGDLDLLVACKSPGRVMNRLAQYDSVGEVQARGETKMTVRLKNGMQVDLRVVPQKSYGAALQYFTGSKAHNILLRRRAQDQGLKVNEYGLFRGRKRVAGSSEEEVYEALGLCWIPPELREARNEIELAERRRLPRLLEMDDIRGDLHMHTTATDGRASLEEMVQAAGGHAYEYIAITDHSRRVTMAKGLDRARLRKHWKAINALADRTRGLTLLKGVELDILENGALDLPDDVLAQADWVVASIHYGQNQSREKLTRRLVNAIRNPHVHAIGHPTGRLIGKRPSYPLDMGVVLKAAADYGCMMEINAQPSRLDLDDVTLVAAKEQGVKASHQHRRPFRRRAKVHGIRCESGATGGT